MATVSLEDRVTILEKEVASLKQLVEKRPVKTGWRAIVGAFLNDPYYEEAMKLGRAYRESTRPKANPKRKRTRGHS